MIGALVPYVQKIKRSYQVNDLVDRLNYQYTALIVGISAMMLAGSQYVGKPIQCWVPAQFTGAWEKYAETTCFAQGSYYVPDDRNPEHYFMSDDKKTISYYQWVPIVLAFQAFLFVLPSYFYVALNRLSGINVKDLLESAAKVKKDVTGAKRQELVGMAAKHLQETLELQRELKLDAGFFSKLRKSGFYLSILYMFSKVLYILNIVLQFWIFNVFLDTNDTLWGWNVFWNVVKGQSWSETGHFPRVTMCDFNTRVLGSVHRWTVQCVLMINMYTEKFYVFFWFWFVLVGVCSIISFVYWLIAIVNSSSHRDFISKYLRVAKQVGDIPTREEEQQVARFVRNYLTPDGVFLMRMIQLNGGDLAVQQLVKQMYTNYLKRYETRADDSFDSPDTTATLPR